MRFRHPLLTGLLLSGSFLLAQDKPRCQGPHDLEQIVKTKPTPDAFNALGAYHAQRQQLTCAIAAFESALKLDPTSWQSHYNLALALLDKRDLKRAAAELQFVVQKRPEMVESHNALGSALAQLGKPDGAEREFKAALKYDPKNVYALQRLTEILIDQGRYAAAITYLKGAPKDPTLETNLAIAYAKNGKGEEAIALLKQLVDAQPDSALAHFNLAVEQAHQKLYQAAATEYREALRLDPANDLARTSLVKALIILANFDEAQPIMEEYARRKPDDFQSPYLLGEVYRGQGKYAEAIPLLQQAVKMRPDNYDAQYNLGFVLAKEGRYDDALAVLNKTVELRPTASEARYQLGLVLRALGQTEKAGEQLSVFEQQRRQTGKKDTAAVVGGKANQYLMSGDAEKAVASYRESLKQDPDNPRTYYNLALALDRLGDRAGERQALEQSIKLDPNLALPHNQLGLLDLQEGKLTEAEVRLKKALSIDPQFAEAQSNLGVLYGQQGKAKEAEDLFRQATENNPAYAQAYMNLGLILAGKGNFPEAEKEIQKSVNLSPDLARAQTALGMVQARLGKGPEAIETFRKVIALDPNSPDAHLNLGIALADNYDVQGALAEFSQAVSMSPDAPVPHYNKGRALFDLKHYDDAKTELGEAVRLAPSYFEALYLLALTEKQLNNPSRSAELLEQAVSVDPRDADAQYLLGQNLAELEQPREAIVHWKKAVEINPAHFQALYNLSRALEEKAPIEAQAYRERFVELQKKRLSTDRATTLSNFAIASAEAHDWQQAVSQLKEALEVCGECRSKGDLHKNLGLIYCRSGDLENGAQQLHLAEKLIPNDPDVKKALRTVNTLMIRAAATEAQP